MPSGSAGNFLSRKRATFSRLTANGAGETEKSPARLVAIASVDRVGKHSFHHGLINGAPEDARREPIVEDEFAARQCAEDLVTLFITDQIEALAVGFPAMCIRRFNAGAVKLRGSERQLIALARRPRFPWALHIKTLALAPPSRKRPIDIDIDTDIGSLRAELVCRHHVIHERFDEGRLG